MAASDESKRVPVTFRCSDEAYDRLFRRQDGRDGMHARPGHRFDHVLSLFCDIVESEGGKVTPHQPPSEQVPPARVRRLMIDPAVKARFDAIAKESPVSTELLYREAIYRFTGMC